MKNNIMSDKKIITILKKRYLNDLSKPDIDPFERAAMIRSLMEEEEWTMSEVAKQYNKDPGTVRDWLLFEKISEKEYNELRGKGVTHTQIFHGLRLKSGGGVKGLQNKVVNCDSNEIDALFKEIREKIRYHKQKDILLYATPQTLMHLSSLIQELTNLEILINQRIKKGSLKTNNWSKE